MPLRDVPACLNTTTTHYNLPSEQNCLTSPDANGDDLITYPFIREIHPKLIDFYPLSISNNYSYLFLCSTTQNRAHPTHSSASHSPTPHAPRGWPSHPRPPLYQCSGGRITSLNTTCEECRGNALCRACWLFVRQVGCAVPDSYARRRATDWDGGSSVFQCGRQDQFQLT